MAKAYFVTGTDTEIGKTWSSSALLHCANQQGLRTLGLKPVAAGGIQTEDGIRNEDALQLQEYASVKLSYPEVCPVSLEEPLSPHIAASRANKQLNIDRIAGYCRGAMMQAHDLCLLEGAGGWRVPISQRATLADLPKALNLPVILVVGLRLGCLNHALLTAEAIYRDGLRLAGWIGNVVDSDMSALDENIQTLKNMIAAPCLGIIPRVETIEKASEHLDISILMANTAH